MDQLTNTGNSRIPRPSRLPVPRAGVRPSPSRENLQQSSRLNIVNPRLRKPPSRDQLSNSTSSKPRVASTSPRICGSSSILSHDRNVSAQTVYRTPQSQTPPRNANYDTLSRTLTSALREEQLERHESRADEELVVEEDAAGETGEQEFSRRSRPSLSERAVETLQNIPSSPAVGKRTSSFYNAESPMRPPSRSSRPGSSYQNDSSMGPPTRVVSSRPSSSTGSSQRVPQDFRASTNTFRPPEAPLQSRTLMKRPSAMSLKTPSTIRQSAGPAPTASSILHSPAVVPSHQRSPSPAKSSANLASAKSRSKTLPSHPLKPRASVNGLFRKPSMPALDQSAELDRIGFVPKKNFTTFSNTSSEGTATSRTSKATTTTSVSNDEQAATPRKTSLALRDQIAKAKAAKRGAATTSGATMSSNGDFPVVASGSFDFGLSDDPFNLQANQMGAKGLLRKRIDSARSDGRLNIAAMGFKEIPEEVMNMYNLESIDGSWAEAVDLTRFVAADNEFELLSDDVFPDIDPREAVDDDDAKGNQFGGLETLDLHGNVLIALPVGLRRLEFLTTLNLSNNKLGNDCFQVISQISSVRDLKIAGNGLSGSLDSSITSLRNLEVLDLKANSLTSLPEGLVELIRLRVLNITENKFSSLPFEVLGRLPLIELQAAKNTLSGVLIGEGVDTLPNLQLLDVTSNALTAISASDHLNLPGLHQLSCSSNRITQLPNMSSWTSLLTIAAEDNNISSIPDGFVSLSKVKNVNFSGNNLKVLDNAISGMSSLDIFRISGNPLRDKKLAGMTTEDLKRALKVRMEPVEADTQKDMDDGQFYSAPVSPISPRPSSSDWPVKPGGILDRSSTQSYSLNPVAAANVASEHNIRELQLHHNAFKEIPNSIAFFAATLTSLSLAHNELTSDSFMKDELELPALKELNLSSNTFNSLQPLFQRLEAPNLERLDISFNRLSSLPILRQCFPNLTTVLASNNTIKELSPEAVQGLRVLDCSSNEINSLNARIGLLGGPGGLERLDVSGNRFRVPKYTILEKGTEATLAWLRDRIPAGEVSIGDTNAIDVD